MSSTPQKRELLPLRIESLTGNQLGVKRVGLMARSFYFLMSLLVPWLSCMASVEPSMRTSFIHHHRGRWCFIFMR